MANIEGSCERKFYSINDSIAINFVALLIWLQISSNFSIHMKVTLVANLKNFAIFTGKHLCWSLFLINLEACRPGTLIKQGSNTDVFLWILQIIWEQLFSRTLLVAASADTGSINSFDLNYSLYGSREYELLSFKVFYVTTTWWTCSFVIAV